MKNKIVAKFCTLNIIYQTLLTSTKVFFKDLNGEKKKVKKITIQS